MEMLDVIIIGAGTAGLSARREVEKKTKSYIVIDDGPLGTTCARVGCMPSKVLIQVANDFDRRRSLAEEGIIGGDKLTLDGKLVMNHVRKLRDRFVRGVMGGMDEWVESHLVRGKATFIDRNTIEVNNKKYRAKSIIVATGSRPIIPGPWMEYKDQLLTSDQIFELETLPKSVAVIGLGVIGVELGQALARLGVEVHGVSLDKALGGISSPKIQDYTVEAMQEEFSSITIGAADIIGKDDDGLVIVKAGNKEIKVERVFLSMGRRANTDRLGFENTGLDLDKFGAPRFDTSTFKVEGADIFIAGDSSRQRPILHEAADEGRIAGYNALRDEAQCFRRRTFLGITFTDPNLATVGKTFKTLTDEGEDFVIGEVSYEGQGRAIVKLKEKGLVQIYAHRKSGKILGAELFAPSGEHLAHLLAWAISLNLTVKEVLSLPYYHPVVEEGVRTAFRDLSTKIDCGVTNLEILRCNDPEIR